ncbi:hypothetical protein TRFO_22944 [Tritrichomonas foetus]|uniref:Uncharacterized protein n=1 Tax=Tritrichomonas foetus TaxID=1144522 RepID=A0A1J4KAR1_9EUKA|nr:hypothetical protein TRFO_22944 [Tritrichomonas foetus]|eukprot:OHT08519.1 hypothetical protein TRFO_22944 [Tritrichomonas foetus]
MMGNIFSALAGDEPSTKSASKSESGELEDGEVGDNSSEPQQVSPPDDHDENMAAPPSNDDEDGQIMPSNADGNDMNDMNDMDGDLGDPFDEPMNENAVNDDENDGWDHDLGNAQEDADPFDDEDF